MSFRTFSAAWLAVGVAFAAETIPPAGQLVAHEWGTFTSVADENGNPAQWLALGGPSALPCFVHRSPAFVKETMYAAVRMETPVIYFYTPRKTALSIGVTFRDGRITEWYPQASVSAGRIEWSGVEALPGADLTLPTGDVANHYYDARATDAVPLRAGREQEKLLFYRGVGNMPIPVRPRFTAAGRVELRPNGNGPAGPVILFENRGGRIGFHVVRELSGSVEVDVPELTGDIDSLRRDLTATLVTASLYPKEAAAMVTTWHDSWFEEGMRVFYVAPRAMIDGVLPMTIRPVPSAMERVFVGRIELLPPSTRMAIAAAAAHGDREALAKYSRFLSAFWDEMKRRGEIAKSADVGVFVPNREQGCAR